MPLHGVAIADRQEPTGDVDGQIQCAARTKISIVEVPTKHVGWPAGHSSHAGRWGHTHHPPKRPGGEFDTRGELDNLAVYVDPRHAALFVREFVGQESTVRGERLSCNGEAHVDRADTNFERVAGFRAANSDRPVQRVITARVALDSLEHFI